MATGNELGMTTKIRNAPVAHRVLMISLLAEIAEARELLKDVINQACRTENGLLDTMHLSAYEGALKYLEKNGLAKEVRVGGFYRWIE